MIYLFLETFEGITKKIIPKKNTFNRLLLKNHKIYVAKITEIYIKQEFLQKNLIFFVVCNILFYKSKYYNKKLKSKREKFVDLANKRVTSAIDKIRLIGNLSDRRFYEYSEKDSKQIIDALTKELSSVKSKFQNNAKKKDKEFSLDL